MMQIECLRKENKKGVLAFCWKAHFRVLMPSQLSSWEDLKTGEYMFKLRMLGPIFSTFISWLSARGDYPAEGHICSITVTEADVDENGNFLFGKILTALKESYCSINFPKAICENDKKNELPIRTDK